MRFNNRNLRAFFALLQAGLWGKEVRLLPFGKLDLKEVYAFSQQQAVVGLVAAGLENVMDVKLAKTEVLPFMAEVLSMEKRNLSMNRFIEELLGSLDAEGIKAVLVKGQGVAQCYLRPNWRSAGDVDLLLDESNYEKAKAFLPEMASTIKQEHNYTKHVAAEIGPWEVELHGNMRANILRRMDDMIDAVQKDTFEHDGVRGWRNGDTDILLPSPDNDVVFIFTHILHHFYRGGIGLRQICDWCRLLYTYREQIDEALLSRRLQEAAIMPEWSGFGHLAVEYLGMPEDVMPFYTKPSAREARRAKKTLAFLMETGNFGDNRDDSYFAKYPFLIRKFLAFWRNSGDILHHLFLFPDNSFRYFLSFLLKGIKATAQGVG